MNWKHLVSEDQLSEIDQLSADHHILIFKHSTSCSISSMAKYRLFTEWNIEAGKIVPYFLDLIRYRSVSNAVAEQYDVPHESPQVLLIRNGQCVYENSHLDIHVSEIIEALTHRVF